MYYFAYCTFLPQNELDKYYPEAKRITKATAANHEIEFRTASGREDRGWCHLAGVGTYGKYARGEVIEINDDRIYGDFDDFEIFFITVKGDDGNYYDCFTFRLTDPGKRMRPPNYYWERIPRGFAEREFEEEYQQHIQAVFENSAECPDFDHPMPAGGPGVSADSR